MEKLTIPHLQASLRSRVLIELTIYFYPHIQTEVWDPDKITYRIYDREARGMQGNLGNSDLS